MFTGIVQAIGKVHSVERSSENVRLVVDSEAWGVDVRPGDSICVNGCCLTHAPDPDSGKHFVFDVVPQTLTRTTLGGLKPGDVVNLEASLTPSTPIGGHFVQGHIDAVGVVSSVNTENGYRLMIGAHAEALRHIVPTGSVAVDGVSLTVSGVEIEHGRFSVALIPTTLNVTTLGRLVPGDRVNIETDILARTAAHLLAHYSPPVA